MKAIVLLKALTEASEQTVGKMADFTKEDATDRRDHLISLFGTDRPIAGKPYKHLYLITNKPLRLQESEIMSDIIVRDADGHFYYMYKIEE